MGVQRIMNAVVDNIAAITLRLSSTLVNAVETDGGIALYLIAVSLLK